MSDQNKTNIITCIVIGIIVLAVGAFTVMRVAQEHDGEKAVSLTPGEAIQALNFTDLEGNVVTLDQFKNRVIVANSWASWCPFCIQELPDFASLANEYASDEVVVLAINRAESPVLVESYLSTVGHTDGILFLLDESDAFYETIGGFSMPETVVYDMFGQISAHKRGFMTLDEMRTLVESALAEAE